VDGSALPGLTLAKRALEIFPGLPSKSLGEMSSAEGRPAPTKLAEPTAAPRERLKPRSRLGMG
jgi:hypothetical protein